MLPKLFPRFHVRRRMRRTGRRAFRDGRDAGQDLRIPAADARQLSIPTTDTRSARAPTAIANEGTANQFVIQCMAVSENDTVLPMTLSADAGHRAGAQYVLYRVTGMTVARRARSIPARVSWCPPPHRVQS